MEGKSGHHAKKQNANTGVFCGNSNNIHQSQAPAPNHLTEHARQIDAIFGDDVPDMSHMENQEEMKEA